MTLQSYGVKAGQVIHCVDNNPSCNYAEFEDLTKVEKYVMSDAEYDKRDDSFRKFRERQLKANPNFKSYVGQVDVNHQKEDADKIQVGNRCEVKASGQRGEVKYVGKVNGFERGYWVGI